ncbi:MAG: Inositol 2-dehydrogenase [Bacteroidota bacterium]
MKKYNVAIVGLGFGAEFIPIYLKHPLANMYAICQRNEEKLNSIGDAYGIETRYTDFEQLIQDPNVDVVHINSPIHLHAEQSLKALNAGKHVACTVPMATSHGNYRGRMQGDCGSQQAHGEKIHDDGNRGLCP